MNEWTNALQTGSLLFMHDDDRTTSLEIKCAFLERNLAALDAVVREQAERVDGLERALKKMQELVVKLSEDDAGEVLGAMPENDPVPRSG